MKNKINHIVLWSIIILDCLCLIGVVIVFALLGGGVILSSSVVTVLLFVIVAINLVVLGYALLKIFIYREKK